MAKSGNLDCKYGIRIKSNFSELVWNNNVKEKKKKLGPQLPDKLGKNIFFP